MDEVRPYIVAIAAYGSISEAARRTHISQPALSRKLRQLETRLGTELFDRSKNPLAPTPAGTLYLEWAHRAELAEDQLVKDIDAVAHRAKRKLRIGVSLSRCDTLLPRVVREFYRHTEGCALVFLNMAGDGVLERALGEGEVDFGVCIPNKADPTLFESTELCPERLLLIAPRGLDIPCHLRVGELPLVDTSSLGGVPFIMPPGSYHLNKVVRTVMDEENVKLNVVLHSCSNTFAIELVRQGVGVAVVPETQLPAGLTGIDRYVVQGMEHTGHLYLCHKRAWQPTDDALVFLELLHKEMSPGLGL